MASSDDLFDRRYKLEIGPDGGIGRSWEGKRSASGVWEGLRLAFRVEKGGDASPNKADLTIYNLSADSRAFVKKGMIVRLEAGYASNCKLVFTGSIELADHDHEGVDWVTKIHSADGVRAYRGIVLSESFGPKTTEESVIRAIAEKMKVTIGELKLNPRPKGLKGKQPKALFNKGVAISGAASAALTRLCSSRGLRWSIQDGVLQVLPYREQLSQLAVLLTPETGLIGSPTATETGVKMVSLMQGGVNPGRAIQLQSAILKGVYLAENVKHEGDTHGNDWYTVVDAIKLA